MTSLLAIDPSSTAAGICYWPSIAGLNPQPSYLQVIRPKRKKPLDRIDFIVSGVVELCVRFKPDAVVIEYSGGRVHGRNQGRRVSGLATLGQGQGETRRAILDLARYTYWNPIEVAAINESWTGAVPKAERARRLMLACPVYRDFAAKVGDPGFDAADAAELGVWWIARYKIEAKVREVAG